MTANSKCTTNHSDHRNNGLITKVWGGAGWTFGHSVTFGYPLNPTLEDKNNYKNFFVSMGDVLPCKYCRESYKKFITEGETALTDEALENRESLTKWFYRVHDAVNQKLEVEYAVTYEDVVEKYESFRAKCGKPKETSKGCVTPLDYKAFSFKKLYYSDAPVIPLSDVDIFINLAKIKDLEPEYFTFYNLAKKLNGNIFELKNQPCWSYRNQFCQKQIRYMRENGISSLDDNGIPTRDELELIVFMCSNLNRSELNTAIEKTLSLFKNSS
uniref:Sulfhydryl oxidase n=1 Tax=Borely moumouvirus TaxID=2712067 RepID=A0A6G6AD63_9VIRU